MIYKITLTNKKTGQWLDRDYDLDRVTDDDIAEIIYDMKNTLDSNEEKF